MLLKNQPSEIIGSIVKQCPGFIIPTALFSVIFNGIFYTEIFLIFKLQVLA